MYDLVFSRNGLLSDRTGKEWLSMAWVVGRYGKPKRLVAILSSKQDVVSHIQSMGMLNGVPRPIPSGRRPFVNVQLFENSILLTV